MTCALQHRGPLQHQSAVPATPSETPYGIEKRLNFVERVFRSWNPLNVLDYGCGTGDNLTSLLAERFPAVRFVGVDADHRSIEHARARNALPNLRFQSTDEMDPSERFDLVIASEVLEHVEDPQAFLENLISHLAPAGHLLLTLPNGRGPFELASLAASLLKAIRVYPVIRVLKRALLGRAAGSASLSNDTLAVSPHINFFGFRQFVRIGESVGLQVVEYCPKVFVCGFLFDNLLKSRNSSVWNARIADKLPPWLNSGWMFLLQPCGEARAYHYRRGPYAKLHRYVNERECGLR
jgi:SAM-dependent methyltransferase